ncbi:MAG: NUDIX hydrolase [Chloroflexota bacterium]
MRNHGSPDDKPQGKALGWETLRTSYPFGTQWLTLRQDEVVIGGKDHITYTYAQAAPAVFIVPLTPAGEVVLIRQYRYTVDSWCLEVPAGGMWDRSGETLSGVARDELREEIGGIAEEVLFVATFYPWTSRSDQIAHVFLARDVKLDRHQELELTERIESVKVPIDQALTMARSGEIKDGQSALALILCENLFRELGYLA